MINIVNDGKVLQKCKRLNYYFIAYLCKSFLWYGINMY